MMTTKTIRIILNVSGAKKDAHDFDRTLRNVGATADRVNGKLNTLSATILGIFSARQLINYADSWTIVGNKIRQASASLEEYAALQARVFEIAQSGRSDIEGVALSFQRIDNSVKEFGYSQADVLDVVDGLTKALKSNGQTAQEVSSVLIQLSQAFAKGRLDGDELRSVMEASLPISRAIAKEFGVNVGQLKDLGEQGKLVSETVFKGLIKALPEFQAAFDKSIPTIADSFTIANNSAKQMVGTFNELTGAGAGLSSLIVDLSNAFDELSLLMASGALSEFGDIFVQQILVTQTAFDNFSEDTGITLEKTKMSAEAWSHEITKFLSDAFLNAIPNIKSFVQIMTVELAVAKDKAAAFADIIFSFDNQDEKEKKLKERFDNIDKIRLEVIDSILQQNETEKQISEQGVQRAKIKRAEYLLELEFNKELLKVERERTAVSPPDKALAKQKAANVKGENKFDKLLEDSIFQSDLLTSELSNENDIIQNALNSRISIYKKYGATLNNVWASEYERRIAQIEIQAEAEKTRAQEQLSNDLASNQERLQKILENETYSEVAKEEAIKSLREQNLLNKQVYEQTLTEIEAQARAQREQAAIEETQRSIAMQQQIQNTYLDTAQIGLGALVNLIGGSKKAGKALRLVQAGISAFQVYANHEAAAAQILATPPGPILNPTLVALAAATSTKGKVSAAAIMAAAAAETFSGGGSSGIGSAGGSSTSVAPQLPQAPETVQSLSIVGNEDILKQLEELTASDAQIPARIMLRYLNSIEAAKRIGA